jgi:hypothetical protein
MKYISIILLLVLSGCGQSVLDKCTDSKSHLWSDDAKSNERYWDAIKQCENKHS